MATELAKQLSQIAKTSTHSLNLKFQRKAHAQSLIFDHDKAVGQDFGTLYVLCLEGFTELCLLDRRFAKFKNTLYSEESKNEDRTQMTARENADLDGVLEDFLGLVGGRLLLHPAIKAVEWLVRRFRIHEYNVTALCMAFLPYHTSPIFKALLAILPQTIPYALRFLHPYRQSIANPPRHTIVYSLITNKPFAAALSSHVLRMCRAGQQHHALMAFWAGNMAEAVSGAMDLASSGRKSVRDSNQQDVLVSILPTLNEGLAAQRIPELRLGCYMVVMVVATKAELNDEALAGMMKAIVAGWSEDTIREGLVCIAMLAERRDSVRLPQDLAKRIMRLDDLADMIKDLSRHYTVARLSSGLFLESLDQFSSAEGARGLDFVKAMLDPSLLNPSQMVRRLKTLFLAIQAWSEVLIGKRNARKELADLLLQLRSAETTARAATNAFNSPGVDIPLLESKLNMTLPRGSQQAIEEADDEGMSDVGPHPETSEEFEATLARLPTRTVDEISFLKHTHSHLFGKLVDCFVAAAGTSSKAEVFANLPILRRDSAFEDPLYFSFFIRIWCGSYSAVARRRAIEIVFDLVSEQKDLRTDLQAFLPYIIAALADPVKAIRRAAGKLLLACEKVYGPGSGRKSAKFHTIWGTENLYGEEDSKAIKWISQEETASIISKALIPGIEEFVLDGTLIISLLRTVMAPSEAEIKQPGRRTGALRTTHKMAFELSLASHAVTTPLLKAKLCLLTILGQIPRLGRRTRTEIIQPFLRSWESQDSTQLLEHCATEQIKPEDLEIGVVRMVNHRDKEGVATLQAIIIAETGRCRLTLVKAAMDRLRMLWPLLKEDTMLSIGKSLLKLALVSKTRNPQFDSHVSEVRELLRSLEIPSGILVEFVESLTPLEEVGVESNPAKRRRLANGQATSLEPVHSKDATDIITEVAFVLELVDSSAPAFNQRLMKALFHALGQIQGLRKETGAELGYLQSIVLSSLLSTASQYKETLHGKVEPAAVRTELLVDCVRSSSSQQVQNSALLLVAKLSNIAPDLVLHNIMPIFTFVAPTVLQHDDDFSIFVMDETLNRVVPSLVDSFKNQNKDPIAGIAPLLWSFTTAFAHVPSHRRLHLYTSLVRILGERDFLFALLVMLADKFGGSQEATDFAVELSSHYDPELQLLSATKFVGVLVDALKPERNASQHLINLKGSARQDITAPAMGILSVLKRLLSSLSLSFYPSSASAQLASESARQLVFPELIEKLLELVEKVKENKQVHDISLEILESVLGLQSTNNVVRTIEVLLGRPDDKLRSKVLRALKPRLEKEARRDRELLDTVRHFAPRLACIVKENSDMSLKHAAISCLDTVVEKYGKSSADAVVAAAQTVASSHGVGHEDVRIQEISLVCLTSAVDSIGPATVPLLATALPRALELLEASFSAERNSTRLHDVVYSFLGAILTQVPWIATARYLDSILRLSHRSASAGLETSAKDSRLHVLRLLSRQPDAKQIFSAIERTLDDAISSGPIATGEHLDLLRGCIEKHAKADIVRHAQLITRVLLNVLDLRRLRDANEISTFSAVDVGATEELTIGCTIKMIMKMNDTAFRPIFVKLLEWADAGLPRRDRRGRTLRLTTMYCLIEKFFGSLKSIATSYASYVLDNAVDVLSNLAPKKQEDRKLGAVVLCTLRNAFEYDQDGFWQSPSRFGTIQSALLSQISHASALPIDNELVPAVVELAAAVEGGPHHKEMNSALLKHMRSDNARVRLAAIRCEMSLTGRLGEDWLALLPEMLPFISELQEDDDEDVERETQQWIVQIEGILGESIEAMLR